MTRIWDIEFAGLFNSLDESRVPDGRAWAGDNGSSENGIGEGGPRYGDEWKRTGAHANDLGLGLGSDEYGAAEEYLAVIKHNGEAFARLYMIDPVTGVFTQVTNAGGAGNPTPQNLSASARYSFVQYEDWVYIAIDDGSQQIMKRQVGAANGTAEACMFYDPIYNRGVIGAEIVTPAELALQMGAITLDPAMPAGVTVEQNASGGFKVNVAAATAFCSFKIVVDLPFGEDMEKADMLHWFYTSVGGAAGWAGSGLDVSYKLSPDGDSTIDAAWLGKFTTGEYFINLGAASASGAYEQASQIHGVPLLVYDKPRVAKRIVFLFDVQTGAAGASISIDKVTRAGNRFWDVAVPGGTAKTGYAIRYGTLGFGLSTLTPAIFTPLYKVKPLKSLDLLGTLVTGTVANDYTGSTVRVTAPFNSALFNQGYNIIEFYREDSVTAGTYYKIGQVDHKDGTDMSVIDTIRQSEVNTGAAAIAFADDGPSHSAGLISLWKQHFVLGADRKVFFSFSSEVDHFVPPKGEVRGAYIDNDDTLGRTEFANAGRTLSARAMVAADSFYVAGNKGVAYMMGDDASEATPLRILPGSLGVTSQRGCAPYRNGALFAHGKGLFYYNVTRAYSESGDVPQDDPGQELTRDERASWQRLLNNSIGNLVIGVYDDEIWAFNTSVAGSRFMRMTAPMPDGHREWQEGTWVEVVSAVGRVGRGLRFMAANGKVYRAGTDATGAKYTTDAGTPVNWALQTGEVIGQRERCTGIFIEGSGTPTVKVRVWDGRNIPTEVEYTLTRDVSSRAWLLNVSLPAGYRHQVQISGVTGTDSVRACRLMMERVEDGAGN